MKKGLVYTGGEWVKGTILSESDGANATVQMHLEDGRDLPVPQQDVIILDQDYPNWLEVAQFLAGTIGETLTLGDDSVKAYGTAQSLATRILATRGVTITAHPATA